MNFCSNGGFAYFKNCTASLTSLGATCRFILGGPAGTAATVAVLDGCSFTFNNAAQGFTANNVTAKFKIINASFTFTATPATLFIGFPPLLIMQDSDLSGLGAGKTIFGNNTLGEEAFLQNCKLGASVTVTATLTNNTQRVSLIRCDSGATNYRTERYDVAGTQVIETTIVRTGGATDGTTPISWNVTTNANAKWGAQAYESIPITQWVNTTGSHTVTVYGTTTGGGVPHDDEIWIEVEYLGNASFPQGTLLTTTKSDPLAASAATNNSSDGSTWAGGGAGNGFKIVTPSFTVNQKGYISVTVRAAKASATWYVDPLVSVG
jgi:hypothetical protein